MPESKREVPRDVRNSKSGAKTSSGEIGLDIWKYHILWIIVLAPLQETETYMFRRLYSLEFLQNFLHLLNPTIKSWFPREASLEPQENFITYTSQSAGKCLSLGTVTVITPAAIRVPWLTKQKTLYAASKDGYRIINNWRFHLHFQTSMAHQINCQLYFDQL